MNTALNFLAVVAVAMCIWMVATYSTVQKLAQNHVQATTDAPNQYKYHAEFIKRSK